MATRVGIGFDLEGLDKAIKNAEKGFDNLIKKGQETEKAIVNNFKNMATQGVDVFVNKLNEANTLLARLGEGKGGKKTAISKSIDDANTLLAVVNKINSQGILSEKSIQMRGTERFVELMNTINTAGKDRTGGRIKQLSEEIDEAKKKLGELQKLLNFYTKGEGKTSYAFADTSATQREAKALMARIEMLEREKEHVQANAALRSRVNDQRIAQQNEINRQYQSSLDKQSQASNNAAKAENRIYEERDKKHEESQRKYEEMGRKMRQQTNQELAAEYEAEQRYNKQRQNNQQSQMEAMRKFAEERAKLEQKEGDKSKTDEHNRLQKEWQEQLKARDAAEKSAIEAEEKRYKQQEKQRIANAVATSNNLDKINERQHRKALQRIDDEAKKERENAEAEAEAEAKRRADYLKTPRGSLESYNKLYSPDGVKSLNQMRTVLKQLETAQANINRGTKEGQKEWKQVGDAIKRVKGDIQLTEEEMGKFQNRQKGVLDTAGQLKRALAAAFSVSAIKGYINKLAEIRGEFEMQQRALQVLLQDKDEANALWDKTVALAVKSPYTTKQLVTATKQLAAYRIESEKLYETNKMLADVSIGLGVDMNRLILAFGQVKAANFLRGTELRQFSEAGVNLLDELADRFTKLEGRMVSVGEVFDRISKRRVTFEDVEAVFQKITGEGGAFYQMQEKQSETLKGAMLNLKDQYELMLNDIGQENNDIIRSFVAMLSSLVQNWRSLVPYIEAAATAFLTGFSVKHVIMPLVRGIGSIKLGFERLTTSATRYYRVCKMLKSVNFWSGLLSILASAAMYIYEMVTATDKLQAALDNIDTDILESFGDSVKLYRELAAVINDTTKSIEEQNKALDKLQNAFGDILPEEYLRLKYLKETKTGYEEAEQAMKNYYNAQSIERKRNKIEEIKGAELDEEFTDFLSEMRDVLTTSDFEEAFSKSEIAILNASLPTILNKVLEGYKNGEKELKSAQDLQNDIIEKINEFLGDGADVSKYFNDAVVEELNLYKMNIIELTEAVQDYAQALKDIPKVTIVGNANEQKEAEIITEITKELEKQEAAYKKLIKAYSAFANAKKPKDKEETKDALEKAKKEWEELQTQEKEASLRNPHAFTIDFKDAINELDTAVENGAYELNSILYKIESLFYKKLTERAGETVSWLANIDFNKLFEIAAKKFGKEEESKSVEVIRDVYTKHFDKQSDEQKELAADLIKNINNETSAEKFAKAVKTKREADAEILKRVKSMLKKKMTWDDITKLTEWDEAQVEAAKKNQEVYKSIEAALGFPEKEKGNKNEALERLKKQIELVRQLGKDYEEMWKKFGKDYANKNIISEARTAAFKDVKLDIKDFKVGTKQDVKDNLNKLLASAFNIKGGRLEVTKAIADVEVDINWQTKEEDNKEFARMIEDMFGDYEITLQLEKFNIPTELSKALWGLDSKSLDDIRKEVLNEYNLGKFIGKSNETIFSSNEYKKLDDEAKKQVEDTLKKISQKEDKELEERLKKYIKYLEKAQTERVRIRLEEAKQLAEIDETFVMTEDMAKKVGLTDEQWNKYKDIKGEINKETLKELGLADDVITKILKQNELLREQAKIAKAGVIREANEKEAKARWKAFESSPEIVSMFGNLESMSNKSLRGLRDRIVGLKKDLIESGLPASDLKKILEQIAKVEAQISENNPFENFKDSYKNAFDFYKNRKALDDANADVQKKRGYLEAAETGFINYQKNTSKTIWNIDMYNQLANAVEHARKELEKAEKTQTEADNNFKKSQAATQLLSARYKMYSEAINDVTDSLQDMLSAFGVLSDEDSDIFDGIQSTINNIANVGANIGKIALNPYDISAYVGAVTSLFGVISDIAGTGDAMKERKIQKEVKAVERLTKKYEQLEEAIDRAYSLDTLKESNRLAQENIEQQIQATERMIALEESKKKTDKEKIQQWRDEIDELEKKQEELTATFLEEVSGVGGEANYKSIAEDFTDAWLNAFYETGDGLTALEENFDEFIKDIVKKQVVQRVAGGLLAPLLQDIDAAAGDGLFDEKEFAAVIDKASQIFPEFNERMKETLEAMGMSDWAGKQGELGSLSAGIQGITSEQSDILASYLNSIRFFVADSNMQLKALVAAQGIDADVPNPMLTQLLAIAEQTRAIRDLFDSVVVGGHKMGRSGIKVFID